jgi:hypothetical protein
MLYIVIEMQSTGDSVSTLTWSYTNEQDAMAKYYSILAVAVTSSVPIHSGVIMTDRGEMVRSERFYHAREVDE